MNRFGAAVCFAGWLFCATASGVLIDDFSSGPFSVTMFSPLSSGVSLEQFASVPGGSRSWARIGAVGAEGSSTTITVDPVNDWLNVSSNDIDDQITFKYFDLQYGDEESPLNLDLTAGGADRFRFRLLGNAPGLGLRLTVRGSVNGDPVSLSGNLGSVFQMAPRNGIVELPFTEMIGSPLALENVESLLISASRLVNNVIVDSISTEGPPLAGDLNRDGQVDAADYTLWRDALAASQPASTPEPGAGVLLVIGACFYSAPAGREIAR